MDQYLLGIDAGTESVRTGVFDLNGNILGFGVCPYKTYYEYTGWAEQKIEEWREALINSIVKALNISRINPKDVIGIGLDATSCSVVFFNENNKPTRDPIIWMDMRAADEAKFIESIDDPARRYNGNGEVSAEWFPCKVLWVKKNQPEVYEKSKLIAEYTDWITFELTGEWTIGINTASIRAYYDSENGGFPREFYKKMGLEDVLEKLPRRVLKLGEVAGRLKRDIADETGLPEGIPIAQGGGDGYIATIGLNAFRPEQLACISGSSNVLISTSSKRFHARGLFGTFPDAIIDDTYVIEGGQTSTGSVLRWFKDNFINQKIENEAANQNMNLYQYLDKQAEKLPLGSEGVIVLEHWQGNRTPFVDPYSRGVVRGLSLKHTPVHIYRAIMEGVAYSTEVILRAIKKNNFKVSEIVACGGITRSKLWLQIYANVIGLPIKTTTTLEAAALGSAILGAVAAGEYESITEAADRMVKYKDTVVPKMDDHEEYKFFVDQYKGTYLALKDSSCEISKHISDR